MHIIENYNRFHFLKSYVGSPYIFDVVNFEKSLEENNFFEKIKNTYVYPLNELWSFLQQYDRDDWESETAAQITYYIVGEKGVKNIPNYIRTYYENIIKKEYLYP